MPVQVTTVSVHPDRAEELRTVRDDHDLPNMDAALQKLIENYRRG